MNLTDIQRETLAIAVYGDQGVAVDPEEFGEVMADVHNTVEAIVAPYVEALARVEALAVHLWAEGERSTARRSYSQGVAFRQASTALRAAAALTPATTEEGR